jgi:hypothetical protein
MSNMPIWLVPEDDRSIPTGALWRQCWCLIHNFCKLICGYSHLFYTLYLSYDVKFVRDEEDENLNRLKKRAWYCACCFSFYHDENKVINHLSCRYNSGTRIRIDLWTDVLNVTMKGDTMEWVLKFYLDTGHQWSLLKQISVH